MRAADLRQRIIALPTEACTAMDPRADLDSPSPRPLPAPPLPRPRAPLSLVVLAALAVGYTL